MTTLLFPKMIQPPLKVSRNKLTCQIFMAQVPTAWVNVGKKAAPVKKVGTKKSRSAVITPAAGLSSDEDLDEPQKRPRKFTLYY